MDVTLFTNLLGAFGLGAASGLNPWIPLLGLGVAQRTGIVELSSNFDWLGATATLAVLGGLFVLDLIGDKVAAIDSVLHVVGLVVAPVSGAIVFSAQENLLSGTHPVLAGGVGLVLGGTVQAARGTLRPAVTATTGGLGNPVVSAIEDVVSTVLTVLAVLVPVLAFLVLVGLVVWAVVLFRRWRLRRRSAGSPRTPAPGPPAWP
ncbi:DUF4126 domain-containing protein [Dermatobacter hominis]|uniref:DUF4126 domain-containing protein n=1 Tax=Dermatobacter hominis TaxID=2884263 RepID=UPI001D0FDF5F|nr:DUF4126 domain-containing protein [Dermatobacter hominis]UDY34679.1 DUF4126 domain-containing protein [Dermatobacter hominis]